MINLLPNEEKKRKVKDFYFRLVVIFLLVISFSMFIATLAILPAYFLSKVKRDVATEKLELQKQTPDLEVDPQISTTIRDLNSKLALLEESEKARYSLSEKIINEILLKKMPDIKINEISFRDQEPVGKSIVLRGIAPTRERLLLFRRTLEEGTSFKRVDLPISNFVKGSNIQFSLSLIPA